MEGSKSHGDDGASVSRFRPHTPLGGFKSRLVQIKLSSNIYGYGAIIRRMVLRVCRNFAAHLPRWNETNRTDVRWRASRYYTLFTSSRVRQTRSLNRNKSQNRTRLIPHSSSNGIGMRIFSFFTDSGCFIDRNRFYRVLF